MVIPCPVESVLGGAEGGRAGEDEWEFRLLSQIFVGCEYLEQGEVGVDIELRDVAIVG